MMRIAILGAMVTGAALSFFRPADAFAQEEAAQGEDGATEGSTAGDRASAFRSVSGPQVERVPGGQLLVAAYGIAWLLVLGFMWRVGRLGRQATADLTHLRRVIDGPEKGTPKGTKG